MQQASWDLQETRGNRRSHTAGRRPAASRANRKADPELASFGEAFSAIARSVGLWNYIEHRSGRRPRRTSRGDCVRPGAGDRSAPRTARGAEHLARRPKPHPQRSYDFGKSILIDAMLLSNRYSRVAIVLPTIALLDEFRRRLVRRFGNRFDVLMHHSEIATKDRVIFLGTQERLINREDLGRLDLVVVDEFYKLDPARKDERSVTLNAAVYRLLNLANQFFFLGPNIDNVTVSSQSRWKFSFLRTRFSTVAVDTLDLKGVESQGGTPPRGGSAGEDNWPALVFVSSPDKANEIWHR